MDTVLTLEPTETITAVSAVEENIETKLTPEEERVINDFVQKIDLNKSQQIMEYGIGVQKRLADFSETALSSVKTKDLGEVGDMLTKVVTEVQSFDMDEKEKKFLGFIRKPINKMVNMTNKYVSVESNINKMCESLENNQMQLMKDIAVMDKMYEHNQGFFKELSMYIEAGKRKLIDVRERELPALVAKSEMSRLPEDAQEVRDLMGVIDRFEKKIHDLELTRMVSIQMAPQIRLVQNNDAMMVEKIQMTIVNTIPLWKSQMVLALGINNSSHAIKAQKEVNDLTNNLLKKNADTLKMATIEVAKESEKGIVDIETLKHTNQSLLTTLDEVLKIQTEGREKRAMAEKELQKIEIDLRNKLIGGGVIGQTPKARIE